MDKSHIKRRRKPGVDSTIELGRWRKFDLLQNAILQLTYFHFTRGLEQVLICLFFYGASSSLFGVRSVCCTLLCIGRYIYVRFHPFLQAVYFILSGPDPSKFDRQRGFSNRPTAVMFVATAINFTLSSLSAGSAVAQSIAFMRNALILNIDYPLPEKPPLVNEALRTANLLGLWGSYLAGSRYQAVVTRSRI